MRQTVTLFNMTTQPQSGVPVLTLGWRLKMALSHGQVTRTQMAQSLGYEESQLSRWMSDKAMPRKGVVSQWALLTRVDHDWLETGDGEATPPPGPGGPSGDDRAARLKRLAERKRPSGGEPSDSARYAA